MAFYTEITIVAFAKHTDSTVLAPIAGIAVPPIARVAVLAASPDLTIRMIGVAVVLASMVGRGSSSSSQFPWVQNCFLLRICLQGITSNFGPIIHNRTIRMAATTRAAITQTIAEKIITARAKPSKSTTSSVIGIAETDFIGTAAMFEHLLL